MGDLVHKLLHFRPTVVKNLDIISGESELLYALLSRKKYSPKFCSPVSRHISEQRTTYYESRQKDSYQITEKYFLYKFIT